MLEKIKETVTYINERIVNVPKIGIILGSGIGELAHEIDAEVKIPYDKIPNFPVSTVKGHKGQLIFGKLNGIVIPFFFFSSSSSSSEICNPTAFCFNVFWLK